MKARRFIDASQKTRCKADITLRDGSQAQCGRSAKRGKFCTQHAKRLAKAKEL